MRQLRFTCHDLHDRLCLREVHRSMHECAEGEFTGARGSHTNTLEESEDRFNTSHASMAGDLDTLLLCKTSPLFEHRDKYVVHRLARFVIFDLTVNECMRRSSAKCLRAAEQRLQRLDTPSSGDANHSKCSSAPWGGKGKYHIFSIVGITFHPLKYTEAITTCPYHLSLQTLEHSV